METAVTDEYQWGGEIPDSIDRRTLGEVNEVVD